MSVDTGLACDWRPSPNHEARIGGATPDILLLHYTAMASAEAAMMWLCLEASRVSSHYLVDETGGIVQMVAEDQRAWHAGVAHWAGIDDVNSHSIGIEIQNLGPDADFPDFPEPQMAMVEALCLDIIERRAILPERVLAHSDVAPGRKIDPGEKFDWARLHAKSVGHWVAPAPIEPGNALGPGGEGGHVSACQRALCDYGYGLAETGVYDTATCDVVAAFQRHFRPDRVDGVFDSSTADTLKRLSRSLA